LHDYHEVNGKLPPAVVRAKDGGPLYSWRVLLLPYLEQGDLYKQFNREEPWDSPHNKRLLEQAPSYYRSYVGSSDPPGVTRYQVIVGRGTAFERAGVTFKDFPDGLDQTFLVVEAANPVPWSKPADLVYDPQKPLPAMRGEFAKRTPSFWGGEVRRVGFVAVFADGGTRFIDGETPENILRALITRNGGEKVDLSDLE
jgi:hypothetical protein